VGKVLSFTYLIKLNRNQTEWHFLGLKKLKPNWVFENWNRHSTIPDVKFHVAAQLAGSLGKAAKFRRLYDIGESNPVPASRLKYGWAQKLISSSMSRHLSTCKISSTSMHAFSSNLAYRQTDKQTWAKTYTSSLVEGNKTLNRCKKFFVPQCR